MRRNLLAATALLALAASPATAAQLRSAVGVAGNDSNPCTPAQPCRTLPAALAQTLPNGEILVLDSVGYGAITITQPVTINAPPGTLAFITATSGNAITVNAGPSDLVVLTGFFLDGAGTGGTGLNVISAGSVSLGGSTVTGFSGPAIDYTNANASGTVARLSINNSSIYSNSGGGLLLQPTGAGNTQSEISNTFFSGNAVTVSNASTAGTIGVLMDNVTMRYGNNASALLNVIGTGTSNAFVQVNRPVLFAAPTGISADGAKAFVNLNLSSASNITTLAVPTNGGAVRSFGNNAISVTNVGTLTQINTQ